MAHVTKRIIQTAALFATLYAARQYFRNWGATKAESQMRLPGDALVGDPVVQTTEAVYIDAPPTAVWSYLLQMGQDQAGQQLAEGDVVRITSPGWKKLAGKLTLTVAAIVPEKYVVLTATRPNLRWNAVWSFHLQPHWEDRVRLLTRVRIALRYPGEVFALELARPVIALGARGVLLRVKRGAERLPLTAPTRPPTVETA